MSALQVYYTSFASLAASLTASVFLPSIYFMHIVFLSITLQLYAYYNTCFGSFKSFPASQPAQCCAQESLILTICLPDIIRLESFARYSMPFSRCTLPCSPLVLKAPALAGIKKNN